jgi:hypothetical protein
MAGAVWHGVWSLVTHSPWIGAVLALHVISSVVRFVRSVIHSARGILSVGSPSPTRR